MNALAKGLQFKSLWWFLIFPSHILFCQKKIKLFSLFINLLFVCIFNGCPTLPHLSHFTPLDVPLHPGLSQVTPKLRVSKIINYTKWHDVEVSRNAPLYTPVSIVIVLWSWLGLTKYFQSYKESFLAVANMSHFSPVSPTGVGVYIYNSTCKCCKNELWSSLESCSQYFLNKNFMVSYGPFFSHLNILCMDTWNGASNIDLHSPTVIPLLWFFAWLSLLSKHHCVGMHEWMEQRLVGYCKLATSTHLYCITPEFIYITGLD